MIIPTANFNALLPCLAVLCALLCAGIILMCLLIAKSKRKDNTIMQKDVYTHNPDTLNADNDNLLPCDSEIKLKSDDVEQAQND